MNCLDCANRLEVVKTMVLEGSTQRVRECKCGSRFMTLERVVKRLPVAQATAGQPPGNDQATAPQPASLDLPQGISKQPLSSDPDPQSSLLSEPRARGKGRPSTTDYTADFVEFWDALSIHRGNKQPAFVAWVKMKKKLGVKFPEVKFIITRYERWAETTSWRDGYALYVATWINARGWETEPEAHEFRERGRAAPARSDGNISEIGNWLNRGAQ